MVRKTFDEKMAPAIKAKMRSLFNADMEMVPDYWPLQRDWNQYKEPNEAPDIGIGKGDVVKQDFIKSFGEMFRDFAAPKTSEVAHGFATTRKPNAMGPLKLNAADVVNQHIDRVSHFLANADDLLRWGKIARTDEFAKQYGNVGQTYVRDLIDTAARNTMPSGTQGWKLVDAMTRNLSVAVLGLRMLSQAKHATNIFAALKEVPANHLMNGAAAALTKDGTAFLKANAPDILNRSGGELSIAEMVPEGFTSRGTKWARFQKSVFAPERAIDAAIARSSWLGAYMNHLEKQGIDPSTYAERPLNAEAARMANVDARKVVTSPALTDVSQMLSRNKGFANNATLRKMFTQFQTTLLNQSSNWKHDVWDAGVAKGNYGAAAVAAMTAMAIMAGETYITQLNRNSFQPWVKGQPPPKKETITEAIARDIVKRVPVIGGFANTIRDRDLGIPVISEFMTATDSAKHLMEAQNKGPTRIGGNLGLHANNAPRVGPDNFTAPLTPQARFKHLSNIAVSAAALSGVPGATTIGDYLTHRFSPTKANKPLRY